MLHGGEIYHVKTIKYDFSVNVNPLGIPDNVLGTLRDNLHLLTQYPDQNCTELRRSLAEFTKVPEDQILCGNGASELIDAAVRALKPEKILLTAPSFSGYRHAAEGCGVGIRYHYLHREEDFALTQRYLEDLFDLSNCSNLSKLSRSSDLSDPSSRSKPFDPSDPSNWSKPSDSADRPVMAILCSPANPVGNLVDPDLLMQIVETCEQKGIWLLVDECFIGFLPDEDRRTLRRLLKAETASETPVSSCFGNEEETQCPHLPGRYSRLLVLDAFTKRFAMPGIRLGYLMAADPAVLDKIRAQQPEWSVSLPAQLAGCAAIGTEWEYLERTRSLVAAERKKMADSLEKLGFRVFPGQANFIFFSSDIELFEPLLDRGILIRSCDNYPGLKKGDFRIAVLRPEDNAYLLKTLEEII